MNIRPRAGRVRQVADFAPFAMPLWRRNAPIMVAFNARSSAPGGRSGRMPGALAGRCRRSHACEMFVVTEAGADAIRAAFDRGGELSAVVELRRLFPHVTDLAAARECVRTIAGWMPLPPCPPRLPRGRHRTS
jgi:hypothetical protein